MKPHIPPILCLLALLLVDSVASAQPLPYRIIVREQQRKSGIYVLLVVKAALTEKYTELTKEKVEATLQELFRVVRDETKRPGAQVDGITAFLYQSPDHIKGGNPALGAAESWPKGHSFSPDNAVNIANKATYVETIEVFLLPERTSSPVNRLPETKRREIFTALVRIEDHAMREAMAKYPKATFDKQVEEERRLHNRYERALLQKYKISEAELGKIKLEGLEQHWPLPAFQ